MKKLNEYKIIKIFQKKLGNKNFVPEDVEVFKIGKTLLITKIDTLVESTDIPPGMKLEDAVRKSVVACVSDFAVKGVKPLFGMISLTIPKKFTVKKIIQLANGFASAAKEFDFKILGGDTNEGRELVIQTSIFGTTKKIVRRSGAKLNDVIITTGPFGYSSAGLKIILNKKKATKEFSKKAKNANFRPNPKLMFGLKNKNYFSSSMDSSDGLAITLHEMARQSRKKFVITRLPANQDLLEFAKINNLNPEYMIFSGGEEYEMVLTVPPKNLRKIKNNARSQKISLYEIGYVAKGSRVIFSQNRKNKKIEERGWVHFQG